MNIHIGQLWQKSASASVVEIIGFEEVSKRVLCRRLVDGYEAYLYETTLKEYYFLVSPKV